MRRKPAQEEEPAETFRIHPCSGKSYFQVLIFKNLPTLKRHAHWVIREQEHEYTKGAFHAICFTGDYHRDGELTPKLGEVMFARTQLNHGIVTHELSHAALYWAKRRRIDPMDDSDANARGGISQEEIFTRVLHSLVTQFHEKCPPEE